MRICGILLLGASIFVTGLGLWSAHSADEMRRIGEILSVDQPEPFDGRDFASHWLLVSASLAAAGIAGTVAGIGMFRLRRWAFALLGCICTVSVLSTLALWWFGYSRYAFERIEPIGFSLTLALAVASFIAYFRLRIHKAQ